MEANEFELITSAIINKLRDEELELIADAAKAREEGRDEQALEVSLVTKDNLITWYLENYGNLGEDATDETISKEYEKIARVIDRMITHDMSLIVSATMLQKIASQFDKQGFLFQVSLVDDRRISHCIGHVLVMYYHVLSCISHVLSCISHVLASKRFPGVC